MQSRDLFGPSSLSLSSTFPNQDSLFSTERICKGEQESVAYFILFLTEIMDQLRSHFHQAVGITLSVQGSTTLD